MKIKKAQTRNGQEVELHQNPNGHFSVRRLYRGRIQATSDGHRTLEKGLLRFDEMSPMFAKVVK